MQTKEEKAAYLKQWRKENRAKCRKYAKSGKGKLRAKLKKWYKELKCNSKCQQCPESHPACMEFHHRDPNEKDFDIAGMIRDGYSIAKIEAELKKCDVLCSNCHRKLHWGTIYV